MKHPQRLSVPQSRKSLTSKSPSINVINYRDDLLMTPAEYRSIVVLTASLSFFLGMIVGYLLS